jgi:hypothetical protein
MTPLRTWPRISIPPVSAALTANSRGNETPKGSNVTTPTPTIRVAVDPTNPGQFFACCGLLELADRLWRGAEGRFADDCCEFHIGALMGSGCSLRELLTAVLDAELVPLEPDDRATSPLLLRGRFGLRLDWWNDERAGGKELKTWAGRQEVVTIAGAMHRALARAVDLGHDLFSQAEVIPDPGDPKKAVAPFYFDARRAAGALNLDVGFSLDVHGIDATSFPAVEFLCLIGLQRFRPARAAASRTYSYNAWRTPLLPPAAFAAAQPGDHTSRAFEYRLLFRTKYLKGFLPATPVENAQ